MSFEFEENEDFKDIDLDKVLSNNENRKPNKLGLYRTTCMCFAASGFGKTTTVLKALLSGVIDDFGLIIIIIPRESLESGYYNTIYKRELPGFMFYIIGEDDLPNITNINNISNEIKKPIAIIMDDYVNTLDKNGWLTFKRYITQLSRVKHGASLFALSQDLYSLKPVYRKGFNTFIIFPASMTQIQFNDVVNNYYQNQHFDSQTLRIMYTTFKKDKHGALWLINNNEADKSMMFGNVWIKQIYN